MKCTFDPTNYPGGMFHCPECGNMVVAGMVHPDYSLLDGPDLEIPESLPEDYCADCDWKNNPKCNRCVGA